MNKFGLVFLSLSLCLNGGLAMAQSDTASKTRIQYYSLYDDGGEHVASVCATTHKLPANLKKTLAKAEGYLGTKQIEFSEKNDAAIDAYQHYYVSLKACKQAIKKLGYGN